MEDDDEYRNNEDEVATVPPNFDKLESYEDYLNHYVTNRDIYYLESEEIARTIVTLGYRVPELLSPEKFDELKRSIQESQEEKKKDETVMCASIRTEDFADILMKELASREKNNRLNYESCIIFIRDYNKKGQEVSGYIDFKARLTKDGEKWINYYLGHEKLLPRPSDLSYYNWATYYSCATPSENYKIVTDVSLGLRFQNKLDRKFISVNPSTSPGDNTTRILVESPNYLQCSLIDHSMRYKA